MKYQHIEQDHQGVHLGGLPTVMRTQIDQHHAFELTFIDGAATQYRIVTRDLNNPD